MAGRWSTTAGCWASTSPPSGPNCSNARVPRWRQRRAMPTGARRCARWPRTWGRSTCAAPLPAAPEAAASDLEVVLQRDRCVVAELDGPEDLFAARQPGEGRRGQVVVQPPAHVLRVGLAAVAPPGVAGVGGVGLEQAV